MSVKRWCETPVNGGPEVVLASDFDAKERECEELRKELSAARGDNNRMIAAQSREGRHALRVENERLREWITQAKHLSNCQFWHGHPSSESEPEVRRWIDGPCTCGRDAALKEQP